MLKWRQVFFVLCHAPAQEHHCLSSGRVCGCWIMAHHVGSKHIKYQETAEQNLF